MLSAEDKHGAVLGSKGHFWGGSMGGRGWSELKALPFSCHVGLAWVLSLVEDTGRRPEGLLGCVHYHDTEGWGQRPLSVLPAVYWLCPTYVSLTRSSAPGRESLDAWHATVLDIEKYLVVLTRGMSTSLWQML